MAIARTEANLHLLSHESYKHTPSFIAKSTFFYIQNAGHFHSAPEYYTQREGYQSILLIYTVKGKGYANYRGKSYELGPGQLFLIDCEDYQEYCTDKHDLWELKWVHFYGCGSEGYFKLIYDNFGPVIDLGQESLIPNQIDQIITMLKGGDRQFEIKSSCLILQMLTEIMLAGSQRPENSRNSLHHHQVELALEYIEKNYSNDISLKDIAGAAGSSVYHFIRIFKKATGYSPYEYLIKYRISKAKSRLSASFEPVERIAEKVGFESASNFIKTFKQIEGITPVKYRKFWLN